jgi:antitoxin component of RelBE/YafQ-DinJ toxin-antitoxin module
MRQIIVRVDDETYRRAQRRAARQGISVSALIRRFLAGLESAQDDFERLKREEKEIRARIHDFSAGDRMPRDEVHQRGA